MAMPRALTFAALLAVARHAGAVGPVDEQALVQRSVVMQQDGLDAEGPLEDRADSSTAPIKELLRKAGGISFGKKGAICTSDELLAFQSKQEDYLKLTQQLSKQFEQDVRDVSTELFRKHVEPLKQAGQRVQEAAIPALKPALRDIIKSILVQSYKPAQKHEFGSVVSFNQSIDKYKTALKSLQDPIQHIYAEAYSAVDSRLNQTLKDLSERKVQLDHKLRTAPPQIHDLSDVAQYYVLKVLPLIAAEIFPSFLKPIDVISRLPKDAAKIPTWLLTDAMPVFDQSFDEWEGLMQKYTASTENMPQRHCTTCQEKYDAEMSSIETGCVSECYGILTTCGAGVDGKCLLAGGDCIKCFTKHKAALDECTGNNTHAKETSTWNLIADTLISATTPQSFDKALDTLIDRLTK